jgi:hypothetical protein
MGRVKVPRCDNCGAPVEFAAGKLEARCEYCNEVLIRELPPPAPAPAPAAHWSPHQPPPAVATRKVSVAPFVIVGVATLAIAGASSVATFASHFKPLPEPASTDAMPASLALPSRENVILQQAEVRKSDAVPTPASETKTTRARPRTRATASAAPSAAATSAEPAKPPPFNNVAAAAALNAAKAKAEASCHGSAGVWLFVQTGFDADGVNRGAALSDPKLEGTPEAKCTLRIFRSVRIPAFDVATRPRGLGRSVRF